MDNAIPESAVVENEANEDFSGISALLSETSAVLCIGMLCASVGRVCAAQHPPAETDRMRHGLQRLLLRGRGSQRPPAELRLSRRPCS